MLLRKRFRDASVERVVESGRYDLQVSDAVGAGSAPQQRVHGRQELAHRHPVERRQSGKVTEREISKTNVRRADQKACVREVNVELERQYITSKYTRRRRGGIGEVGVKWSGGGPVRADRPARNS